MWKNATYSEVSIFAQSHKQKIKHRDEETDAWSVIQLGLDRWFVTDNYVVPIKRGQRDATFPYTN